MPLQFSLTTPGPIAFPVTPMHADGSIDLDGYRRQVEWMMGYEPPALFVACGTGEFMALAPDEVTALCQAAVEVVNGACPVYVGTGGSVATAVPGLRAAEEVGAVGALVFPPYLRNNFPDGLLTYYRAVIEGSGLRIILYQRDGVSFEPAALRQLAELDNFVGLKDGSGEIERITRIVLGLGDRLSYFNGMPTAETFQPSYAALGVPHYSSAVFNFVPEISWAFYKALNAGDRDTWQRILKRFFIPFAELRNEVPGYAVSLVKAGASLRRGEVGPVRAPLPAVSPQALKTLGGLIQTGLELAQSA